MCMESTSTKKKISELRGLLMELSFNGKNENNSEKYQIATIQIVRLVNIDKFTQQLLGDYNELVESGADRNELDRCIAFCDNMALELMVPNLSVLLKPSKFETVDQQLIARYPETVQYPEFIPGITIGPVTKERAKNNA